LVGYLRSLLHSKSSKKKKKNKIIFKKKRKKKKEYIKIKNKKKKKKKKKQLQLLLNQRFDVVSVERKGVVKGKERRSSSLSMLVKEKKRR